MFFHDGKLVTEEDFTDEKFREHGLYDALVFVETMEYGRLLTPAERIARMEGFMEKEQDEE